MNTKTLIVTLIMLLFPALSPALAAELEIEPSAQHWQLGRDTAFWRDESATHTLDDVLKLAPDQWTSSTRNSLNLGYDDAPYWIHTRIRNMDSASRNMILELNYPVLDHVELFQVSGGQIVVTVSIGVHTLTPSSPTESPAFFAQADQALYQAKALGRNCVVAWQNPEPEA